MSVGQGAEQGTRYAQESLAPVIVSGQTLSELFDVARGRSAKVQEVKALLSASRYEGNV